VSWRYGVATSPRVVYWEPLGRGSRQGWRRSQEWRCWEWEQVADYPLFITYTVLITYTARYPNKWKAITAKSADPQHTLVRQVYLRAAALTYISKVSCAER
jgi:hypothetical protein